jgi:hypothetical protein
MRWLRDRLLPPVDDTEVDRAKFRQREQVSAWERIVHENDVFERVIRGERRHRDTGRVPERRHG